MTHARTDDPRPPLAIAPASLHALAQALAAALGPDAAPHLQEAGYAAGVAHAGAFREWLHARGEGDPEALALTDFVARVSELFRSLGWGELRLHPETEPATVLEATGWAEWRPRLEDEAPTCHFSTGMLAGFFGTLAGEPLAVLEVASASGAPGACRFLMGSAPVMAELYERHERGEALV